MSFVIFPTSPPPADMTRKPIWNAAINRYDSGVRQGSSPYRKPLYKWSFNLSNIPISKQTSLEALYNDTKSGVRPFLFMDPYVNRINGIVCVNTGTAARSFFVVTAENWPYIPASGTLLITSALSGALTQNTHYSFNDETGVFSTHLAPSSADYWVASCQYFRKVGFDDYSMSSKLWQEFHGNVSFSEIALP